MDGIKSNRVAENGEGNASDRENFKRFRLPRSERLSGPNFINRSSFLQLDTMGEMPSRQHFVVSDKRSFNRPELISSLSAFEPDRKSSLQASCNSYHDELMGADSSQKEWRSKGNQNHSKYVPSAYDLHTIPKSPSQMSSHDKQRVGVMKSYSLPLSRFSSQTCGATMSTITSSSAGKERIKSPSKRNRYFYQLQHSCEEIDEDISGGDDLYTCESRTMARYENFSSPKQKFRNWLPACRRSNHSAYHSPVELSSIKTWPTHQHNRHSLTRKLSRNLAPKIEEEGFQTKRAARRPLGLSTGVQQPFSALPEVSGVQKARSRRQIQVSNITPQPKGGCCLPPVEIVTDYSGRSKPEKKLPSRLKSSSKEDQPYTIEEDMPQDREYANLQRQRPRPSAVQKTPRGQEGDNCSVKQDWLSNQSTLILEDPFSPSTEDHNEQFPDEIRGPQLNKRRNAVCNELEKETNRVKINGFRMSLYDMRVDLGELTKKSKIRESVLENSELKTGAVEEDNAILEGYLNSKESGRRKAVCQEIEKRMNTFKVNGARMSLCHMRAELGGLNQYGLSDEKLEEELNKPGEMALDSPKGYNTWKQRRRRTTAAIRKFITDFSN